jgi:hypothetical protein
MHNYLGSTIFGFWVAEGKQSICFPSRWLHDINRLFIVSNPSIAHLGTVGEKQEDSLRPESRIRGEPPELFIYTTSDRVSVTHG